MNRFGQTVKSDSVPDPRAGTRDTRILDAAAHLITHYGYDKTTVSDIAREAGISKGAIYLHFETKEALFEALLKREIGRYAREWIDRVEADPRGGTLGGMYRAILGALESHPFVAAMLRGDDRVFGNYLRRPDNLVRTRRHMAMRQELVVQLQSAGVVRQDMDAKVVAHIMNMLALGWVGVGEIMDPGEIPPTRAVIEGIAEIFDRALTPDDSGASDAGKAVIRAAIAARAKPESPKASGSNVRSRAKRKS